VSGARGKVKDAVSAGGVVWRRARNGTIEVVLCGRHADHIWVLPKGTPDPDEPIEATALREVQEETGLLVRAGPRLPSINYWFVADGVRYHKHVHHWLMEPVGGDTANHDAEFDEVAWASLEDARGLLSYANERRVLEEAARLLQSAE
jgi:8-oxo-dGTP pyrophosphatase MutT (NUDIX family)